MENTKTIGEMIYLAKNLYEKKQKAKLSYLFGETSIEDAATTSAFYAGYVAAISMVYGCDSDTIRLVVEN